MQASSADRMFNMMSIPFEGVDGKGISLNAIQFSNLTPNARAANADQISLWALRPDGTYNYESWYAKTVSGVTGWYALNGGAAFDTVYPNGLPAGTTFWYKPVKKSTGAGAMTASGAVVGDETVTKTIKRDSFNFVGSPYPVALNLNDLNMVDWGEAVANARAANADQIQLWIKQQDGSFNYESWYIKSVSGIKGWYALNGGAKFEDVHPKGVIVGTGFWYKAKAKSGSESFDITFKSPLAKAAE